MSYIAKYILTSMLFVASWSSLPAQLDRQVVLFTYELYTEVEGQKSYVDLLQEKTDRYSTKKIYLIGSDTIIVESYDASDIRETTAVITDSSYLVFFERTKRIMNRSKSLFKEKITLNHRRLKNKTDTISGFAGQWYKEKSVVGNGEVLYASSVLIPISNLATRNGLYYNEKLGLLLKEKSYIKVNENAGIRRHITLLSCEVSTKIKPTLPDFTAPYKEESEVEEVADPNIKPQKNHHPK